MAKYKAYPEYKKINSFWVNIIPSHWNYILFKRVVCDIKDGTHGTHSRAEVGLPLLSAKNIQNYGIEINDDESLISEREYREITRNGFPQKNDLLITCVGTIGRSCVYPFIEPIAFQRSVAFLRLSTNASPYFYKYYVESKPYQCQLEATSKTSAQSGVYMGDLVNTLTVFPTTHEQVVIAEFLDHETAKIDNLIEKQQQLIELLKEKRQAVISHAVTKGLNPDVPMKDSGVEWLGEVPEHWDVKRIKHFGKVVGGFAFKSGDFTDEGYPVIKISNVSHLNFDWTDSSFLPHSFSVTNKEYLAPKGALIFAMTRPVIAGGIKVTLLDNDSAPLVNQRVGFMVVKQEDISRYILISTQSSSFLAQFVNNMTITNQPNISSEGIESIYLPVPPVNELSSILKYLDNLEGSYSDLIDKASRQVSLLQERRTALISAAVTGKIDVRDWVAPNACEAEVSQEVTA
ncbi:restriction endonuclease subunit S [Obesumbacterium proteus]|uniref:restriction endonuclease subunit S n=1 Tax=Obesumbacterium proteus TaxID=82983 RepID=UPI00242F2BB5|nr:restriction endonuclease subunit S [Obesumbacterium proteus]